AEQHLVLHFSHPFGIPPEFLAACCWTLGLNHNIPSDRFTHVLGVNVANKGCWECSIWWPKQSWLDWFYFYPSAFVLREIFNRHIQLPLKNPGRPDSGSGYEQRQDDSSAFRPLGFVAWGIPIATEPIEDD